MNLGRRFLFLIWCSVCAVACAPVAVNNDASLTPGQLVDDFSLAAAINNSPGQRLAEQRGSPVMLILTGRCNGCEALLAEYQRLALQYEADGLVTWVIWTPYKQDRPPVLQIPVLMADAHWQTGWQFRSRPAVMLINRDGVFDYLIAGDLQRNYSETEQRLTGWIGQQSGVRP